jgi:hypothetical protein
MIAPPILPGSLAFVTGILTAQTQFRRQFKGTPILVDYLYAV